MAFRPPGSVYPYYKYLYTTIAAYSSTSPMVLNLRDQTIFVQSDWWWWILFMGILFIGVAKRAVKLGERFGASQGYGVIYLWFPHWGAKIRAPASSKSPGVGWHNGSQITIDLKRPTCNGVTMEKTQVFVASIFFFFKETLEDTTHSTIDPNFEKARLVSLGISFFREDVCLSQSLHLPKKPSKQKYPTRKHLFFQKCQQKHMKKTKFQSTLPVATPSVSLIQQGGFRIRQFTPKGLQNSGLELLKWNESEGKSYLFVVLYL